MIHRAYEVLEGLGRPFEVVVCDDGSRDGTARVLDLLREDHPTLTVVRHETNLGVGQALKTLYRAATGERVAFFPADGQVDPGQVERLLEPEGCAVVLGVRRPRRDSPLRLAGSWAYNALVRLLFGLPVRDADSVALYHRVALDTDLRARDLCVPVEILLKAHRRGLRFTEVTVEHRPRTTGRAWGANPRVAVRTLAELLHAWWDPDLWGLRSLKGSLSP